MSVSPPGAEITRHKECDWAVAAALSLLLTTWAATAHAAPPEATNWPQWRGPLATGVSPTATPPVEWSETKNIKWKVKIPGRGSSTPIVWGEQIFLQTAIPTSQTAAPANPPGEDAATRESLDDSPTKPHQFVLLCLDRATGETRWSRVVNQGLPHEGHHRDHGFASFSPATDGEVVIAYFGSRGVACFDMRGELQWQKDLGRQQTRNAFGEGSSPALAGDTVVINWDHEGEDDFTVALDKRTGKERWRQKRSEPTTWATPLIVEHNGRKQVITPGSERVRAYDLQTGEMIWHGAGLTLNAIPSPVAAEGVVYLTSGFRGNALRAIRLGHTGDVTDSEAVVWSLDKHTPYVPSPLLSGHRLYFFSSNNAILSCYDARSGAALYGPKRVPDLENVYASPVAAAGRVYLVGRNGAALVIEDGDEFKVLAANQLDERIDASPALVGREMFFRGQEFLYCIAEED